MSAPRGMLMPRKSPFLLNLTVAQRRELEARAGAIRCRIVTWSR